MILAEKIMKYRKENGWSQEDLAAQLGVSRQSVSKWESTASIPDLDKILKMSELFGVSTDYLLKDDLEEEPGIVKIKDKPDTSMENIRKVSVEDANTFMDLREKAARKVALGVALCITSPLLLIILAGWADAKMFGLSENMAAGIGVIVLLLMVAGAVTLFILNGMKLEPYEYLEKELLELEYGVAGIAQKKHEEFGPAFKKCIACGVALCIVCAVPLMIAVAFATSEIITVYCVGLLLLLVALGVYLFVWSGMIHDSYLILLEEGDHTREKKLEEKRNENLAKVYWSITLALYLGYSLITMKWNISWVIWPVAGILYAAVCGIAAMIRKK